MRMSRIFFAVLGVIALTSAAQAGPRDIAIHVTRMGGDAASAQPYVDRFLRYMEKAVGWEAGSMKGRFLVTSREAQDYVATAQPGFGMLEPPLFFELRAKHDLKPILQLESTDLVTKTLHVVVKDPAIQALADLKGRKVCATLAEYPAYLSKVVLDGQVDAAADWKLKPVGQALRVIRGVLRGDCDATLLDDEQLAKAREITGGGDLRAIATSPALPPIPVVTFGSALPDADREALVKALLAMCDTPDGGAICKEMHIGRLVPVDEALFTAARTRLGD
jgi:ABC-type phosphate/phosphonate transport system substrate-binding protein